MIMSGICLITENVQELAYFYSKLLDKIVEGDGNYSYIKMQNNHISFCSVDIEKSVAPEYSLPQKGGRSIIELNVEEIDILFNRVSELNFRIIKPIKTEPWGIRSFWVEDPDGNITSFCQRVEV